MQGHFVESDGCAIHAVASRAHAHAPWLVFSNSLMTDHAVWDRQVEHFADRFNILRYDQRGHGRSDAPEAVSFNDLSGDVLSLLDHFGIERCVYIGLSMGVPTGIGFAASNPDRVSHMILCDGQMATLPTGRQTWQARIDAAKANGMAWVAQDTIQRWFASDFIAAGGADALRASASRMTLTGYAACAAALQEYEFTAEAAALPMPVLLLAGSNDGAMPQTMRAMADTIGNARFHIVEGAGHIPNLEKPERFNALLDSFLKDKV